MFQPEFCPGSDLARVQRQLDDQVAAGETRGQLPEHRGEVAPQEQR
jgi:hypothetical protein